MKNDNNKQQQLNESIKKPKKKDNNDSIEDNINDEATTVHTQLDILNK